MQKVGRRAKRQPLSGALASDPGDVVIDERLLAECKVRSVHLDARGRRILSIDYDWLLDVTAKAKRAGFDGGALVTIRPKGSKNILALVDLRWLLDHLDTNGNGCDTAHG